MASGTLTPPQPKEPSPVQSGRYEAFIEERLHYTRRQVKLVDVATGLMALLASILVFLLGAAVIDQWLIEGGLGFWGRLLAMLILAAGAGWFFWRRIAPPLLHRVNPVFAAQTIEHTRPTLKNSLINFLLMRTHRREVPTLVYQALEQRAATDLTQVKIEAAVDHRRVVHWGYALTAVVAVFALYMVFSPKNLWVSAARVLLPWASIHAPTRVTIDELQPGNTTAFYGEYVRVSAQVAGLRDGEPVTLVYSTADGQSTDQVVVLTAVGEANQFQCTLPPGSLGLQQDIQYRLRAGDCETETFRLTVEVAPAILVEKIDYRYPGYTGIPPRSTTGQGDLRAVEGTRVTVRAAANHPIKTAEIDLDCDGRHGLAMEVAGDHATGQLALRMQPDDSGRPQHDCYQLRFTDTADRTNRRPIRYRIEVIRDIPPEVLFISPVEEELKVPVDGRVEMRVRAEDADFGLRQVAIRAEQQGRPIVIPPLLNKPSPEKAVQGRFEASFDFLPAKLGLKPGDRITYWAEAEDNKEPEANRSETGKRTLTILAPEAAGGENRPQARPKQAPGKSPKKGDPAEDRGNPQPKSKPGDKGDQPNDQGANPSTDKNEQGAKPDRGEKKDANDGKEGNQNKAGKGEAKQSPEGNGSPNDQQTENGSQNADQSQADGGANQANQPVNPDTNPGDAFEKILNDRKEQKAQQQADAKKSDGKSPQSDGKQQDDSQQADGKQKDGSQGKPQDQLAANNPKDQPKSPAESKPESGGDQGDKQSPDQKQDGKQQDGKQQAKPQNGGGEQAGSDKENQSAGKKPDNAEKPGGSDSNKPNKGSRSDTQNQQSSGAGSEKPSGGKAEDKKSPDKAGDGNQAGKKSEQNPGGGDGKQDTGGGQDKPGGGKQDDGKNDGGGQGKPDDKKPSGGQKDGGQKGGGGQEKPDEKKASGGQQGGEQGGGGQDKPDEKKAAGGQKDDGQKGGGGKEKTDEKKQPGGSQGSGNEGGAPKPQEKDKQEKSPQSGGQSGGGGEKPGEKKPQEKKEGGGGSAGGEKKKEEKSGGGGESGGQEKPGGKQSKPGGGEPKGGSGNDSPRQQAPGKGGDNSQGEGSPSPQEQGQSREMKPDNAGQKAGEKKDEAKSPSNSPKNSDSKGDTAGDKQGGGEEGGGQHANKKGMGTPGSHMPAEEGGSTANQRGQGETGNKTGEQVKTSDTKSSATQEKGPGSGERHDSDDKELSGQEQPAKGDSPENKNSNDAKSQGGRAGSEMANKSGTRGSGTPTVGGQPGQADTTAPPPADKVVGGDDPNMDYARKQVDLALDHLKDQLAKDKPKVLDKLGWNREDARRFLENWRKMQQAAAQPGPKAESARKALDEAIKSLGLRPQNTRLSGGHTHQDKLQQLHDAGRFDPPSNWAEQVQEYTKGVATGGR